MRVLITGGCGYIGSNLSKALAENNIEVSIVDDLSNNISSNCNIIKPVEYLTRNDIAYLDPDIVIHLSAIASIQKCESNRIKALKNIESTKNLINIIGDRRLIFASSCAAIEPVNTYGFTKKICEDLICNNLSNYCVLRLFNVAGAYYVNDMINLNNRLIPNVIKSAERGIEFLMNPVDCVKDYVHVYDVVRMIIMAITSRNTGIYDVGTGVGTSISNVIQTVEVLLDKKVNIKNVEPNRALPQNISNVASIDMTTKDFGWYPIKTLADIVKSMTRTERSWD